MGGNVTASVWLNAKSAVPATTGLGVRVGILDSGWDRSIANHRIAPGISFVDPTDELRFLASADDHDRNGHGTTCTSVLLDVAPDCEVVPIRVFGHQIETSPDVLIAGIDWATAQGLPLLNVSLGTFRRDALRPLYGACQRARSRGTIIVAAARRTPHDWAYPAVFEPVIGVGAVMIADPYAVRYTPGAGVECALNAVNRNARGLEGRSVLVSGTSFAAPVVTGLIARWLEDQPGMDLDLVRNRMAWTGAAAHGHSYRI